MQGAYFIGSEQLPVNRVSRLTTAAGLIATKQEVVVVIDAIGMWFNDAEIAVVSQFEHAAVLNGVDQLLMEFHVAVPIYMILVGVWHDDFDMSGNSTRAITQGAR